MDDLSFFHRMVETRARRMTTVGMEATPTALFMRPQYRQPGPVPESWNDLIKRLGGYLAPDYLAPPLAVVAAHITAQVWGVKWRDGSCSRRGTSLLMVDLLGFWGTTAPLEVFHATGPVPPPGWSKKSNRSFCQLGNQIAVLLLKNKKVSSKKSLPGTEHNSSKRKEVAGQPRRFRKWALQFITWYQYQDQFHHHTRKRRGCGLRVSDL